MTTEYWLTRLCFQRALAFIYLIGFLIVLNQFRALAGSRGLLPAPLFIRDVKFLDSPSLFFLHYSDTLALALAWAGLFLSVVAVTGISDAHGPIISHTVWFLLWVIYLSFVNIGQTFYGFGWETLLLETGFLAIFLGPSSVAPPVLVIWLIRWILFRLMFGAGLIKLRGDPCWRDLTCMQYHYETQPLPNPLSWYFHHLPQQVNKASVLFTHFVELVVPFGLFGPRIVRHTAGWLTVVFQIILILSGNLSWLNCITLVLCIACFDDSLLSKFIPLSAPALLAPSAAYSGAVWALVILVGFLSIQPVINLFSPRQAMNRSFEPLHLVNTYGAFGSVTRERNEIVIEGTDAAVITPGTDWKSYEFKGKPGSLDRTPPQVTPYHFKLDWQMWFAAMGDYSYNPWIVNLVAKILKGDAATLSLMGPNPFPDHPPKFVRAQLYLYHFTNPGETGWWKREYIREYLPPLSLDNPNFRNLLRSQEWDD